ncbi:Glycosyltransferase [Cedratvirus A11]|uniref:Glycosyltransferase n=1 Tax=Cedratvirus A11 TaxID=1903266 RepID=A0A1M7XUC6_9VIRU|nr:Glycosyltransferase [Cedratvirus A11]SHO33267.1 Glycosyltransferase [Cedratvirus A11]
MELYVDLAKERYQEVWDKVYPLGEEDSFETLDVAFVAAYYYKPDKVHEIASKIYQRCEDETFLTRLRHYYKRVVENLDTVKEKKEIAFYHPSSEKWGPEKHYLLEGIPLLIHNFASLLSKDYKVVVYSNPLDQSKYRLSTANPQYKPIQDYEACPVCISTSTEEKVRQGVEKFYLLVSEGGKVAGDYPLIWLNPSCFAREKTVESEKNTLLVLPPLCKSVKQKPKRNQHACVYAYPDNKYLPLAVKIFEEGRKKNPKLTLDVYTFWKSKEELSTFQQNHPQIKVKDLLDAPHSLGKYTFWINPEKESFMANLARESGCLVCDDNLEKEEDKTDQNQTWEQGCKRLQALF